MANPPKKPVAKLTPGAVTSKMESVRAAKKKKEVKKGRGKKPEEVGNGETGGSGHFEDAGAAGEGEVMGIAGETPALVFTQTNNNRQRALEEARRACEKAEKATSTKPGDIQLQHPAGNNHNLVVVVPSLHPRREIVPPKNRGAVQSLADWKQAEEDAALLSKLEASRDGPPQGKVTVARKRKVNGENDAPMAKRARRS
ncbi:hypothetical protein B0H19DRAFT_1275368 [Mycena capillaripes]|nr:hypothetical protein B0H19DRAFT_1275368 [Mycena capillaripes]